MRDRVVKLHFKIEKHADIQRFMNSSQSCTGNIHYGQLSFFFNYKKKKKRQDDTRIGLDK